MINMSFDKFYGELLDKTTKSKKIEIFWKVKDIIWMASYKTIHKLEYIKIVMKDQSFLCVMPLDKLVYYSAEYVVDTDIFDDDVWVKEVLIYKWKKYKLENKDDYQYVTHLYIGDINTIEWECIFSDYVPEEWNDFLSLGWIVSNEERADIHANLINIDDIKIV